MASESDIASRRTFLSRVSLALSGLAAAVMSVPIIAYLVSPIIGSGEPGWRDVGPLEQFTEGQTVEVPLDDPSSVGWAGLTSRTAVWLRRLGGQQFQAFQVNCTHLGCPVSWRSEARLFFCPCHGGVYYEDGRVAAGPPPRPLVMLPVEVRNGRVLVGARALTSTLT